MLQLFETERFLFDRAVPCDREALWAFHGRNCNRRPPSAPGDITGGIFACLAPLAKPNPIPTSAIRGPLQDARAELSLGRSRGIAGWSFAPLCKRVQHLYSLHSRRIVRCVSLIFPPYIARPSGLTACSI